MRQMMAEFIRSHTDAGKRISDAWAQGDRKAAVRMAHNLKGVAGVFSARALREAALNLETALQKAPGAEMPQAAVDAFESALSVVVESMEKITGETDDGVDAAMETAAAETKDTVPGTESKADLGSLFHHLADLLDRRDMDAQEHLPAIRRRLKSSGIHAGDGIGRVEAAVDRLDYQEARRELDSVMAAFGYPIPTQTS
jgi:two-component system sensor histidine kinase/response regulator